VRLTEKALNRWIADLEQHLHASRENRPGLQSLIVGHGREPVDALPAWDGRFPGSRAGTRPDPETDEAPENGEDSRPPESARRGT
jgi:hypothetical protein